MNIELSFSLLILRLGLAVTFFAHGSQHLFGWFGGRGFKPTITNWKENQNIPIPIGVIGILTEFFGCFAFLFGYLTRPFALLLIIFLAVAAWKSHWEHGFFMGRPGSQGSGIEYCLALMIMCAALLIGGSGAISLEWLLS